MKRPTKVKQISHISRMIVRLFLLIKVKCPVYRGWQREQRLLFICKPNFFTFFTTTPLITMNFTQKCEIILEFELFCLILQAEIITLYQNIMNAVIERTPRSVTVRMSTRRWNKMLELEQTYKLARIISRSMHQVESEPSMTPQEAIDSLRAL